jgi:ribosomal protein S15P/S13E
MLFHSHNNKGLVAMVHARRKLLKYLKVPNPKP